MLKKKDSFNLEYFVEKLKLFIFATENHVKILLQHFR